MKMPPIALFCAGLGLLAVAGWMATFPRPNPRPDLPEIAPFQPGERIALVLGDAAAFPPAENLGLVQRARAAGADVRVFSVQADFSDFQPNRAFRPVPWPEKPTGYHPDQWPIVPPAETAGVQMLPLLPAEIFAKNAAVIEAARVLRESGTDDARGSRELQILSRARRAEIYSFLPIPTDLPALD